MVIVLYLICYDILLQNVTDIITKCDSHFITKCDRSLLKNATDIKKCVRFFIDKMRQLLQNTWILLQNSSSQKGNEDDTFYRGYMRISKFIFSV